jgi:4-carboxymuconolactone decarboxylase
LARIPLLSPEAMSPEQRKVFDDVTAGPRGKLIGPLRAAIHRADLADVWQRFGAILRYGTSLPPRLSELAILVTARRWNSELEWQVHSEAARKAGLDERTIEDLRQARSPSFDELDELEIYEFARELQMSGQIGDEVYAAVKERWGTVGVVELTALIGYYTMVSMTLNAHELPGLDDQPLLLQPTVGSARDPQLTPIRPANRVGAAEQAL